MATLIAGTITGAKTGHRPAGTGQSYVYSDWYTGSAIFDTYNIARPQTTEYYTVVYRVHVNPQGGEVIGFRIKGYLDLEATGSSSQLSLYVRESPPPSGGSVLSNESRNFTNGYHNTAAIAINTEDGKAFQNERDVYVEISQIGSNRGICSFKVEEIGIYTVAPDLSISMSPASAIAGNPITADITGRYGRNLNLTLTANGADLTPTPITITSDSQNIATEVSWFDTASVTGNSMTVTATVTDPEDGRTASADFTLTRPQPLTVTAVAPKSTTKDGAEDVTFSWSVSGSYGSQDYAELQYSYDNANWRDLGSVSGSGTTLTKSGGYFSAGTVYWRVRVRSTFGIWSSYATANYTVQYYTAAVSLIAPTSGTREGGETIEFAWSIAEGSGSINGVQMQTSSDDGINWTTRLDVTTKRINFVADPATLPPGALKWRVRVKDSYAGWSEWKNASVTIKYSATSYVVPLNSPTGGNVNAAEPINFAGTLLANGVPYQPFTIASATFYWRSRTADPYTEVSMTPEGANASVVIPSGTFPPGSVYWYIEATDNTGASTQTDVYTISTLASKIDAAPVAPVGVIETKNTPTIFRWRYATVTGSEQKAAELEYSIDGGASWIELGSVQGEETSYTAAANALPSGTITWRVRAENAANEWGEWSAPVSFVNFGAPDVFSVLTDGKPYTTITWQVNTQESYKIFVDGVQIGPYHGEDVRSYTLTQPLADGQHTVQIQVQNEYSQWSPINGTVFDVVNTPGAAITLSHNTDVDVELTWTAGDGTGNYYVYRDGVPIAHTGEMEFVDRVALGTHEYFVIEKLASGDYNRSNTVTATPSVGRSPMIAPLAGGEWLPLALSLNSDRVIQISDEVRTSERFVLGADFPVVTIGRHRTRRVSLDAAWLRSSIRNDEFMALLGKAVILKLPWGKVFVGVLPSYAQSNAHFTSGYAYSISQADWRDYIENA